MSGFSTADAAEVLDCTKAKISHIETGHVPVRTPDLTALTRAYGLTGPAARDRLASLALSANRRRHPGWWRHTETYWVTRTATTSRWCPSATA